LVVPDDASKVAIGGNIYDFTRRAAAADAGREQGASVAAVIARERRAEPS
jgi:hypothetical protein